MNSSMNSTVRHHGNGPHNSGRSNAFSANVLVLNRFYVAVHVVNVRRGLALLYRDHAEVVHLEDDQFANYDFESWRTMSELRAESKLPHEDWIRAVNFEFQIPRVLRLLNYDRIPRRTLRFNRRNLFARDGYRCQYCRKSFSPSQLSMDHVIPRSHGGKTSWQNVVCCCLRCNVKKGGRTPREARMTLFKQPTQPKYSPHLAGKLKNPKYACWQNFLPHALEVA